jgi:hypothetical protein
MHPSRWPSRRSARRRAATRARRRVPLRLSTHAASAGLVAVLLVLTVFSVGAAVTSARVSADAKDSAAVSAWAEKAERSIRRQESLANALASEPDADLRAEYEDSSAATRTAIEAMATAGGGRGDQVREWLRLHARYDHAVKALIAAAATNPRNAEAFADTYVAPYFETSRT